MMMMLMMNGADDDGDDDGYRTCTEQNNQKDFGRFGPTCCNMVPLSDLSSPLALAILCPEVLHARRCPSLCGGAGLRMLEPRARREGSEWAVLGAVDAIVGAMLRRLVAILEPRSLISQGAAISLKAGSKKS